ncbi:MAG TPA: DNA polymerase III subunit alpha, partial [Candidatus Moranbacteria bacterium]|nr:DNA polymerase III subunit alpha [Candidatus Moranbacteria bacterium]
VYQEQVMQIAQKLAGFSLGEADILRKAMGKKVFMLVQKEKHKFIEGCIKNGNSKPVAEKVFSFIEPFAGYGFNRSHAACYALIGYQTAYLKAYFPAEFMAALLTSDQDNLDRVAIEITECREMGIEVMSPDINESFEKFTVITDKVNGKSKERIRFGLNAIKNVGHTVARAIVEEREKNGKYKSLTDFIERVRHKDLNKKSIEALAKVGALEKFGERNALVNSIETILAYSKNYNKLASTNQNSLFEASEIKLPEITLAKVPPASKKDRLSWEKELLGLYISDHPVKEYADYFQKVALPIKHINSEHINQNVTIGGIVSKVKKIYLKNQKTMLFATIEDLDASLEAIVFPKVLEVTESVWVEEKIISVSGKISNKDGELKILVDSAKLVTLEDLDHFKRILTTQKKNGNYESKKNISPTKLIITLPPNFNQDILKQLSAYLDKCESGKIKVYLIIENSKLETPYNIKLTDKTISNLKAISPTAQISVS